MAEDDLPKSGICSKLSRYGSSDDCFLNFLIHHISPYLILLATYSLLMTSTSVPNTTETTVGSSSDVTLHLQRSDFKGHRAPFTSQHCSFKKLQKRPSKTTSYFQVSLKTLPRIKANILGEQDSYLLKPAAVIKILELISTEKRSFFVPINPDSRRLVANMDMYPSFLPMERSSTHGSEPSQGSRRGSETTETKSGNFEEPLNRPSKRARTTLSGSAHATATQVDDHHRARKNDAAEVQSVNSKGVELDVVPSATLLLSLSKTTVEKKTIETETHISTTNRATDEKETMASKQPCDSIDTVVNRSDPSLAVDQKIPSMSPVLFHEMSRLVMSSLRDRLLSLELTESEKRYIQQLATDLGESQLTRLLHRLLTHHNEVNKYLA